MKDAAPHGDVFKVEHIAVNSGFMIRSTKPTVTRQCQYGHRWLAVDGPECSVCDIIEKEHIT